jgi:hypothetical protein
MEFVCFYGSRSKQQIFALQKIKRLVFITEAEGVYSAVRTESIYNTDTFRLVFITEVVSV